MYRNIWKVVCTLLIIVSAFMKAPIAIVSASPTTTVSVEPPSIIDTSLVPGKRFTINVTVTDVVDLWAWQIKLYFDKTILNCTPAWAWYPPNHVFAGRSLVPVTPVVSEDGGGRHIIFGCSLQSPATPVSTAKGTLCQINFSVIGVGSSDLTFSTPLGEDTYLLGPTAFDDITFTVTDGYFSNKLPPPTAKIYVDPPKIVDPSLVPCKNFTIEVDIINATDVYSLDFKLGFNQSVLNVVEVIIGDFFPPSVVPTVVIDNVAGYVWFSVSLSPPKSPISGNGTLAVIKFHVENSGTSVLHLYEVQLRDQAEQPLPFETFDGYFNNVLFAKLYVEPPEIIDPTLKPPATININITIDDVENMYGYEFKLGFDKNVLVCIGVAVHPVLGETNYIPNVNINNIAGIIWVNVTYYSPAVPITTYTPVALVTITFRIKALGTTVLDLYDTNIVDQEGHPIPHEVGDGFFMNLIRDVAIINVVPSTSFAYEGELVNIYVTAKNKGNATETFDVKAYYDTELLGTQNVANLPPNAESTLTFTWDTSGVGEGNYTIKGEATLVPYEFNTTNNIYIDGTVEVKMRLRDLAILSVTADPNATYAHPRWPVNITVVAENQGMEPETFEVSVYWNDTHLISNQTVTGLAPNTTITLTFIWDTTDTLVCHKYKISAAAPILPFEKDTADNSLDDGFVKIKLMGDINGDNKVNIRDIAAVAECFGTDYTHPRWNPDVDLNRDGKINIRDIALAAGNYGKTCSC